MAWKSFYDILEVDKSATLEEIKLAFKRRALQVHPDKGGSKEAFHLVYQALETLADPAARKKYDHGLATGKSGNLVQPQPDGQTGRKKTSKKRGRSSAGEAHPKTEKAERPKPKAARGQAEPESETPQAPQSKQTKLLIKIRDLLKQLPRDVRNDVFTKQFSQKQRLILEKWMVDDASSRPQAGPEPKPQVGSTLQVQTVSPNEAIPVQQLGAHTSVASDKLESMDVPCRRSCDALAMPAASSSSKMDVPGTRRKKLSGRQCKIRDKKKENTQVRSTCGAVMKEPSHLLGPRYRARIRFDALEMYTRTVDLQTALEFLVILTSVKQKRQEKQEVTNKSATFEERLQEALLSSAKGQESDLDLRFSILQAAGFLIAPGFTLRTPKVRNVEQLGRLRRLLEPFRTRTGIKKNQMFVQYSPAGLQDSWEQFQKAVAAAWEITGVDSTKYMEQLRAGYAAAASSRQKHLQWWERRHMNIQDKNIYRPQKFKDPSTKRLERRERLYMAKHDKKKLRPTAGSLEHWERQQMAMQDQNKHRPRRLQRPILQGPSETKKLLTLKLLLARWQRMLNFQQKKNQEKRRRLERLKRKRLREEERIRREEAARKRMRSTD